jgi:5-formyltetrahydrofolate cyclo-ligase
MTDETTEGRIRRMLSEGRPETTEHARCHASPSTNRIARVMADEIERLRAEMRGEFAPLKHGHSPRPVRYR